MISDSSAGTTSHQLHVFLCHDLRDKEDTTNEFGQREKGIVIQLSKWLEAHNINVWRSDKELVGGETWKRVIYNKAIPTCDLFIVCLTNNFVDDTPGQRHREVVRALEIAETKHPDTTFIIPIRIKRVHYSGFEEKQYINYYKHLDFDIILPALEKKRKHLIDQEYITEKTVSRLNEIFPTDQIGSSSIWNVPHMRNPHFTGRDELLNKLTQQFPHNTQDNSTIIRRNALTRPLSIAIKGLGGIGKTQIAAEYAYLSRDLDRYTHTLWINAASEETIIASFVTIANLLPSFSAKNETNQQKLAKAVKHWLEKCEQRWLLIFDNADYFPIVQEYLPQSGNGNVLITTRANAVGSLAISVEVENMGFIEGIHLLLRRAQRFEQASDAEINQAGNIVVALDHFPLALDQAGAYIEETQCSFVNYLDIYQKHRLALLAHRGMLATDYPNSVATTWSLSFQKVQQANPAAAELLCLCAFLAPDRIPEELIMDSGTYLSPLLQKSVSDLFSFNQMMAELLKFSLVKRLIEAKTFSIHRLVQAIQKDTMEAEEQSQWAKRVIQAVNEVFPDEPKDMATWPQCLRYLDQVQVCNMLIEQYTLPLVEAADLLNRTGFYLDERGLYTVAKPLLERSLAIREQELGASHLSTAESLNSLAVLHQNLGKYGEAEPLYQRALAINEQELGAAHPSTAQCLNNLAALYQAQGKYGEAEPLYQRALAIREQELGTSHLSTASSLNSLALLYYNQGKYGEAEPMYQRALAIREQELGAFHPSTARSLNSLAGLYQAQGKYDEAERLHQHALAINEQGLGASHLFTASSLNNLAALYQAQGKYDEAEPLYQRALKINEQELGAIHPSTSICLNNLAVLYQKQGKYGEAEPLYQRALAIREQELGAFHPSTAMSLNNLAVLYQKQGKYDEAEPLYQRALAIREQELGAIHPYTAQTLNSLAALYQAQGKYGEAKPLYQRALEIREKLLGPDHSATQDTRKNYASLLRAMKCDEEARQLEEHF